MTAGAPMMTTTKTYDSLNRLTKIESTTGGRPVSSHTYGLNQANQRTKRTDADGSYWDYGYDSLGQVTNAVRKWASGTNVVGQSYSYQFDDIGNRRQSAVGDQLSTYTANLLNQYTQRTVPGFIDILGSAASNATISVAGQTNVLRQGEYFHSELALANTNNAAYSSLAIIASMTSGTNNVAVTNTGSAFLPKTPEQFTHDQDGNLIRDGRWTYTWDGENRLLSAESLTNAPAASKRKVEWTYDGQGRRIRQKVYDCSSGSCLLTADTRYVYDGWQCLAEVGPTGSVVRSYAWGLDLSGSTTGAGGIGGLLFGTFNGSSSTSSVAYAYDGNGNVTALLDMRTGQLAAEYEYSPFGETIRATGALAKENPYRFSTKRTDDTTGLILYEYRVLNPVTGRWLSRDPIEDIGFDFQVGGRLRPHPFTAHVYLFVYNNPGNRVDVLGLKECKTCGPDVTFPLQKTLSRIVLFYRSLTKEQRVEACTHLTNPQQAGVAWDITELARLGFMESQEPRRQGGYDFSPAIQGQGGRCAYTVAYKGLCYKANAVNYIAYGKMMSLCGDTIVPGYSRLDMLLYVTAWKALYWFADHSEASGFANHGYTELELTAPSCEECTVDPNNKAPQNKFMWTWTPYHH